MEESAFVSKSLRVCCPQPECGSQALPAGKYRMWWRGGGGGAKMATEALAPGLTDHWGLFGEMGCPASSPGYIVSLLPCPCRDKFLFPGRRVSPSQHFISVFVCLFCLMKKRAPLLKTCLPLPAS